MDDTPDADEAYGALTSANNDLQSAKDGLQGSRHNEEDAIDIMQGVADDLSRLADDIHDARGLVGAAKTDADSSFDSIEEADSRLSVIGDFIEAAEATPDGEPVGEIEIDGNRYDVLLSPQDDGSFAEWLGGTIGEMATAGVSGYGSPESLIVSESLVSRARLEDILGGSDPRGDEAPSIIKALYEGGYIDGDERNRAEQYANIE
jgi:hypothetical protein